MKHSNLRLSVTTAAFAAIVLVLGLTPLGLIPIGPIKATILCIPVIIGTLTLGLKAGLILGFCFGLISTLGAFNIMIAGSSYAVLLAGKQPIYAIIMSMIPRLCVPITASFVALLVNKGNHTIKSENMLTKIANSIVFLIALPVTIILLYTFKLIPFWITILLFVLYAAFEFFFANKSDRASLIISSVSASLTNTVLYLGLMLLFYTLAGITPDSEFVTQKILEEAAKPENEAIAVQTTKTVRTLIAGTGIIAGGSEAILAGILCPPIILAVRKAKLNVI